MAARRDEPTPEPAPQLAGPVVKDSAAILKQLAFKADVSRNYVSLLELGEKSPTVQTLLRLCKAMGVKASTVIARIERS